MPLFTAIPPTESEPRSWMISFANSDAENEKWERLEEFLSSGNPVSAPLLLDTGSPFLAAIFQIDENYPVMQWVRCGKELKVTLNRTTLKALTELRVLTAEGAGDYFFELLDNTGESSEPQVTDVGLHLNPL